MGSNSRGLPGAVARIRRAAPIVVLALAVLAHLAVYWITLVSSPLGFDEAYVLQAPLNLVDGNGFSTEDWIEGGPRIAFDAVVSTGPVLGLPTALSFAVLGASIESARIVTFGFFLLLLAALTVLGRRVAGWWGAAAALLTLLVFDTRADFPRTVIYGPSDAIGEYSAAALIAAGFALLPRWRSWAGLLLGLTVMTKTISGIALLAALIVVVILPPMTGRHRRSVALFSAAAAAPFATWEAIRFVSLGPGGYWESLKQFLSFVYSSGSGGDGSVRNWDFYGRATALLEPWQVGIPMLVGIVAFVAIALAAVGVVAIVRDAPSRPDPAALASSTCWMRVQQFAARLGADLAAVVVALGGTLVWWILVSTSPYTRHTFPLLFVLVPVVVALAVRGGAALARRGRAVRAAMVGIAAAAMVLAVSGAVTVLVVAPNAPGWSRDDQLAVAAEVRALGVNDVQGLGWWAAPSIRFLSGVPSTPIGTGTGPLVLEPITRELDPATYQLGLDLCVDVLLDRDGYVVCTVPEDTGTIDFGFVR